MGLIRTSSPSPILTAAQARAHLRIDDTAEDDKLVGFIATATDYVERETATAVGQATYTLTLDAWPTDGVIRLPVPPLVSIESIQYRDPAGNLLTLSATGYAVDAYGCPGRVVLFERPSLAHVPAAVRITFSAGYDTNAVPPTLLHAVRMLVGHYFENREAAIDRRIDTVPLAVESLLLKHTFAEAV